MYLETRDINEMMNIYTAAWKKGVKTTYYLHMKPRHTAEQSTTRVNKSTSIGKKGFASLRGAQSTDENSTSATMGQQEGDHMMTNTEDHSAQHNY